MRLCLLRGLLAATSLLWPFVAHGELVFNVDLTTDAEPPPIFLTRSNCAPGPNCARPEPFGEAEFIFDGANLSMTATIFNIDVTGSQTPDDLNDNLVAAHVHVRALSTSITGPVRWGFFGNPDNDIDPSDLLVTPFSSGVGGVFTSVWNDSEGQPRTVANPAADPVNPSESLAAILGGLAYLNFHTVQKPGGEIRGDLLLVSEPGTLALLLLTAVIAFQRRLVAVERL